MSWKIKQKHEQLRDDEQGFKAGAWSKACNVALVYPNLYYFGMSNLGFQTLFKILNTADLHCERFFLPDVEEFQEYQKTGTTLLSVDRDTPATEFDLIAFSISYQNDALNVPRLLKLMRQKLCAHERDESDPLVIAGGPALTINPLPLAEFFDAIVIGEGEEVATQITEVLTGYASRHERLFALSRLEGVFVPQIHLKLEEFSIKRLVVNQLSPPLAHSQVLTPHTEFGDLYLIEVQRGCQWACRFCAAGYIYRYPRYSTVEELKKRIDTGFTYRKRMGLIAGDLLGYEGLPELLRYIDEKGGGFSPSSVRLNAFTPEIIHYLQKSGNRTIAIAPEGGSERLRRSLNKTFTNAEVVRAAEMLASGGITNIKLYIMVGLPDETDADLNDLCELVIETRTALQAVAKSRGVISKLTLSLSPFTPKPATPFGREPYLGLEVIKQKLKTIQTRLAGLFGVAITGESGMDAYVETLLSRGDARVSEFVMKYETEGRHYRRALKNLSFDPEVFVTRQIPVGEKLPWDFINHGMKTGYLDKERERGRREIIIPSCEPVRCHICGIC